jgi:outer membrane protein assembly factor BamA
VDAITNIVRSGPAGGLNARSVLLLCLLCPLATVIAQRDSAYTGPYVVSGIVVEGNRTTKERVILRELTLAQGDTVATNDQLYYLIERSRQNVYNMGLFNSVRILPLYLSSTEVFLTVTVSERWFYWPTPIFKYSDPNFNTWWLTKDFRRVYYGAFLYRYNMRGRNETLYAKVQLGYAKEFALRYRFPFIDKRQRWGLAFGAGRTQQDEITVGTAGNKREFITLRGRETRREWKGDLEATLRPAFDMKHAFRIGYVHSDVLDSVARAVPTYFTYGDTRLDYFQTGFTFTHDQRDNRVYPLSGTFTLFRADHYGLPFLGDDVDLTTFYGAVQRSWHTSERWSLGGSLRGKVSVGPELPYYMQQGLGYEDYVRGYEYYVIDGEHYALLKANAIWALVKPREYVFSGMKNDNFSSLYLAIYLNTFADFGHVWDSRYGEKNFLANELQSGYGLGVNVVSSYDQVMRIEFAVNAMEERAFYLHFAQPF